MTRRTGSVLAVLGAMTCALLIGLTQGRSPGLAPRPPADRPTLALLTSLPLMFGESFGLDSGGSPALTRMEERYNVHPIGVADEASLAGHRLLLMAHPRAQPAEALVELDAWVRDGGNLLLLADPRLDWDSARPFGDRLRPPPGFADTGLLGHWGLTLEGPTNDGPSSIEAGGGNVLASSPGALSSNGRCNILNQGFVARCPIGRGTAIVVADADFLDAEGEASEPNLDFLMGELAELERSRPAR